MGQEPAHGIRPQAHHAQKSLFLLQVSKFPRGSLGMRGERMQGATTTAVAQKERIGPSLWKCRNSANCRVEHQDDNVYSQKIIKEATVGGRGEKLGLPGKQVKKTQCLKDLIVFYSLNSSLPPPSACLLLTKAGVPGPRVTISLWGINVQK